MMTHYHNDRNSHPQLTHLVHNSFALDGPAFFLGQFCYVIEVAIVHKVIRSAKLLQTKNESEKSQKLESVRIM
jgi:hypothetical protein